MHVWASAAACMRPVCVAVLRKLQGVDARMPSLVDVSKYGEPGKIARPGDCYGESLAPLVCALELQSLAV